MTPEKNLAEVKDMIQFFYRFAGISPSWNGNVNEKVAEIFGIMLEQTARCSDAINWIPTPPTGPASIKWLATSLGKAVYNHLQNKLSITCARGVIYKWNTQMEMASMGLAYQGQLVPWA